MPGSVGSGTLYMLLLFLARDLSVAAVVGNA